APAPARRSTLRCRKVRVEQPALDARDLFEDRTAPLADRCRRDRQGAGGFEPVDEAPRPQALGDAEGPFEILRAAAREAGLEQPAGEPVVILRPGGERLR